MYNNEEEVNDYNPYLEVDGLTALKDLVDDERLLWGLVEACSALDGKLHTYAAKSLKAALMAFIKRRGIVGNLIHHMSAGLRKVGDTGVELAEALEGYVGDDLTRAYEFWHDDTKEFHPYAQLLLRAVEGDIIAGVKKERLNPPGLNLHVASRVARTMHYKYRTVEVDANGTPIQLIASDRRRTKNSFNAYVYAVKDDNRAAIVDEETAQAIIKGTEEMRSLTGQRLLLWLITEGAKQHFLADKHDRQTIRVKGGVSALAELIGSGKGKSARAQLSRILLAGSYWRMNWAADGDGTRGTGEPYKGVLWNVHADPHGPGKPRVLEITLGEALTPAYTQKQPKGRRMVAPLVDIEDVSGFSGTISRGPLAAFKQAIVWFMAERALEAGQCGGFVQLDEFNIYQLSAPLGLSLKTAQEALAFWSDKERGNFLIKIGHSYALSDNPLYARAKKFLDKGASLKARASANGKKSAANRRRRLGY